MKLKVVKIITPSFGNFDSNSFIVKLFLIVLMVLAKGPTQWMDGCHDVEQKPDTEEYV